MFLPVTISAGSVEYESLEQFGAAVRDMRTPLEIVGERILAGVGKAFATEGASGDRPWVQLTEGYRQWKEARVAGLPILIGVKGSGGKGTRSEPKPKTYSASGKMREELIAPTAVRVIGNRLVYAPESDIAGFHQEGTDTMAPRPPVVITLREEAAWVGVFGDWLDGLAEKVRL